jgi:uncharacterized cupin superfamily protein
MEVAVAIEVKNTRKPDVRRDFYHGHIEVLNLSGLSFGVVTCEPGWRWAESVRPIAGTESCEKYHTAFVVKGRMRLRMKDGEEAEVGPGDVFVISPGHDSWVVGDETFVAYDFSGEASEYAKRKTPIEQFPLPYTASDA